MLPVSCSVLCLPGLPGVAGPQQPISPTCRIRRHHGAARTPLPRPQLPHLHGSGCHIGAVGRLGRLVGSVQQQQWEWAAQVLLGRTCLLKALAWLPCAGCLLQLLPLLSAAWNPMSELSGFLKVTKSGKNGVFQRIAGPATVAAPEASTKPQDRCGAGSQQGWRQGGAATSWDARCTKQRGTFLSECPITPDCGQEQISHSGPLCKARQWGPRKERRNWGGVC